MNELATIPNSGAVAFRTSTDAAGLCKEIVVATARNIQGRKYVQVEGWQAIAIAHGCTASAENVERIEGGFRATGVVKRMSDGFVIATGEGFVGDDEKMWANRPVYARRAMAQTRAISRACRAAFAHVVVMMNAGLQTTPAEEIPEEAEVVAPPAKPAPRQQAEAPTARAAKWLAEAKAALEVVATATEYFEWVDANQRQIGYLRDAPGIGMQDKWAEAQALMKATRERVGIVDEPEEAA